MPPALIVLADAAEETDPSLADTLDHARRVSGVGGRVLLFHPPAAEGRLTAKALGYRLWPQEGDSPGQRFANAFRQAADLGYEGAVVIGLSRPCPPAERISAAAALLAEHPAVIAPDGEGGIGLLALQGPEPTLFAGEAVPAYDEFVTRATQQRVRLVELPLSDHVSG